MRDDLNFLASEFHRIVRLRSSHRIFCIDGGDWFHLHEASAGARRLFSWRSWFRQHCNASGKLIPQKNSQSALDRYDVKMKTPVRGDTQDDAAALALSYQQLDRFNDRKL